MRLLLPRTRSFLIHSGQTAALLGAAVLAMAAAPMSGDVAAESSALTPLVEMAAPAEAPMPAVAEPAGPILRNISFQVPLNGYAINSRFGMRHMTAFGTTRMHEGVDIAAPHGTPVLTTAEGEVVRTGFNAGGYGHFIEVRHPNGLSSFYGHLSRVEVRAGDRLSGGERIGRVGSTGRSTGPHLHFEIRRSGAQMNPESVLGRQYAVDAEVASAS